MSKLVLSVPSKTFLLGEYVALNGGPAIIMQTEPRFLMEVESISDDRESKEIQNPFHQDSIAGKLFCKKNSIFSDKRISFIDPHNGSGGWGRSSAEFALLYALAQQGGSEVSNYFGSDIDLKQILTDYQSIAAESGKPSPSGADVIGQITGGVTFFHRNEGRVQKFSWPFSDIGVILFSTGTKLKTHEHLEKINNYDFSELIPSVQKAQQAFQAKDSGIFVQAMNEFAQSLSTLGLVAEHTINILKQINHPSVLSKKGCGALGADVVAVVFDSNQITSEKLCDDLKFLNLKPVASHQIISKGLEIEYVQ